MCDYSVWKLLLFSQAQEKLQEREKWMRELQNAYEKSRADYRKADGDRKLQKQVAEDEQQRSVELLSKNAVLENKYRQLEVKLDLEQTQQKQWRKLTALEFTQL